MKFAWLVPVSDEVAEVGSLRHRFDETPLKPAEPSCPFPAVTIKLEGRRAARYALGMGGRGDRQTVAKTGREGGGGGKEKAGGGGGGDRKGEGEREGGGESEKESGRGGEKES